MKKKTRVLIFSTIPTHPQDMGCRRRVHNLLEGFQKQECEIHLAYFPVRTKAEEKISTSTMSKKWDYVHLIRKEMPRFKHPRNFSELPQYFLKITDYILGQVGLIIKKVVRRDDLFHPMNKIIQRVTRASLPSVYFIRKKPKKKLPLYDLYYEQEVVDIVEGIAKKVKPHIFICEYAMYSFVLKAINKNVLTLIDTHDSIATFSRLHPDLLNLPRNKYITKKMEQKLLRRADISIAIQEQEEKYFKKILGRERTITIGHSVIIKENPMRKKRTRLLFVGSDWPPNKKGIIWFLKEVWPLLKEKDASITLDIIGDVRKYLSQMDDVHLLGKINYLDAHYKKADVIICPIYEGSGLKIKAIEALGFARPIVATSHVAEGFGDVVDKKELFRPVDEPLLYAQEILSLLRNDVLYKKRQKQGMRFAQQYNREQNKKIISLIKKARIVI